MLRPSRLLFVSSDAEHQGALRLVISYLYQDAAVFDNRKPESSESETAATCFSRSPTSSGKGRSSSSETTVLEPNRVKERREQLSSMRSRSGAADERADAEELAHGTIELTMDPWDEWAEGEDEAAAGFGSFGGAYGSPGKYDGAGLDRLMGVMAAARTLELYRLQVFLGTSGCAVSVGILWTVRNC